MSHEPPMEFMEELKEAIADAIRSSPRIRSMIARARNEGLPLDLALVVGVLSGRPDEAVLEELRQTLAKANLSLGTLEGLEDGEPADPPPGEEQPRPRARRRLRLEITTEDLRYFRSLGLKF